MRLIKPKVFYYHQNRPAEVMFLIEPLERGVGNTIGKLVEGYVVRHFPTIRPCAIKFSHYNINTPIDNIPGVSEAVDDIIENLKRISPINNDNDSKETFVVKVDIDSEGKITAKDLKNNEFKFVNEDVHLFTINDKKKMTFEVLFKRKAGFHFAEDLKKESNKFKGFFFFDTNFSPVVSISYKVKNMRVGESIKYDSLNIFIEAKDGFYPENILQTVIGKIKDSFSFIYNILPDEIDGFTMEDVKKQEKKPYLDILIDDLELTMRCRNCLKQINVKKLGDLTKYSEDDLMRISNFGKKSLDELRDLLLKYNLSFKETGD